MLPVLLGTTNPAKVQRFTALLAGCGTQILTPAMLDIPGVPEETGATPLENARLKAAYYGGFCDRVICNDSGLYIEDLEQCDPRQPGMRVRSPRGARLDDAQMIAHYSALAHRLGGRMTAYYLDGVAAGCSGEVMGFMDEEYARRSAFWMVETPHPARHPGWPLDSLSVDRGTGKYFVEDSPADCERDHVFQREYWNKLRAFLLEALRLETRS